MTASETREMDVQIISIRFDVTIQGQSKPYPGTEVIYRTSSGDVNTKNLHANVFKYNKQLRQDLEKLAIGDYIRIVSKKDGDFVNWQSVTKIDSFVEKAAASVDTPLPNTVPTAPIDIPPSRTTVKSNYETPEERALRRAFEEKKQVYIIRQSSIDYSLKFFALNSGNFVPEVEQVLAVAKEFEAHVFRIAECPVVAVEAPSVTLPD